MGEPLFPPDATPEQIRRITRMVDGFLKVKPPRRVDPATATPSAPTAPKAKARKPRTRP